MLWAEPVEITLPDGYSVGESADGTRHLYDPEDKYEPIVDDHGHPAIVIGAWQNKDGKPFTRYQRLDK